VPSAIRKMSSPMKSLDRNQAAACFAWNRRNMNTPRDEGIPPVRADCIGRRIGLICALIGSFRCVEV
jgi:hypothetical protein